MQSFTVYFLVSKDNKLALGSICSTRDEAERKLKAEFPEGHVIYEGFRVFEGTLLVKGEV